VDQLRHLTVVPADQNRFTLEFFLMQVLHNSLDFLIGLHGADIQPQLVSCKAVVAMAFTVFYGVLKLRHMQAIYDARCPPKAPK
jgi:hypothetical protein